MIDAPVSLAKFAGAWLPALAVSAVAPEPGPQLSELFVLPIGGVPVPVVTCSLAALGIVLARPFARRTEAELGWPMFALVTLIMLIVVELWVIESRPGWLFAFVVAIGMGFSGYSLLELFGEQVKDFVRDAFGKARDTIGRRPGGDE